MNGTPTTPSGIIDVHLHCFTGREAAPVVMAEVEKLQKHGVRNLVVVGMINRHLDAGTMWNLVPDFVDNRGNPSFDEAEDLLEFTRLSNGSITPFVDTRHLWGDVAATLGGYLAAGFRGLKGIYLPDNENDLGVGNVPDTFGITLQQYRQREWEIFSFAQAHDLPVLYHMDARRYGDVMLSLLQDFPDVRVNFPHFGISRRAFSGILDRFPNVYTDFAGMHSYLRENPASYRDFIMHYSDRVCFGSDAFLYQTHILLDYIDLVKELNLPQDVEARVMYHNPVRFLAGALS